MLISMASLDSPALALFACNTAAPAKENKSRPALRAGGALPPFVTTVGLFAGPLVGAAAIGAAGGGTLAARIHDHLGIESLEQLRVLEAGGCDVLMVERGPFRMVRHPSYTGLLLAFVGLALTLGNWAALLVILLPIGAAFIHRMNVEENALSGALGSQYTDYIHRTKRLVPFVF